MVQPITVQTETVKPTARYNPISTPQKFILLYESRLERCFCPVTLVLSAPESRKEEREQVAHEHPTRAWSVPPHYSRVFRSSEAGLMMDRYSNLPTTTSLSWHPLGVMYLCLAVTVIT